MRWRWLLLPDRISVGRAVAIYFVATFLNWLLPVQGGELAKSLALRHLNGIPVNRSLATVTVDKAMDLVPAVVLVAVAPFAQLHLGGALWVVLILAIASLLLGSTFLVVVRRRPLRATALPWTAVLLAVSGLACMKGLHLAPRSLMRAGAGRTEGE